MQLFPCSCIFPPLTFTYSPHVIEGKIKEEMEVARRRGRRRKKLLDDLKDRRGYSHLKEEALDRTIWRHRFGGGFGPVVRQNTEWMNEWILPRWGVLTVDRGQYFGRSLPLFGLSLNLLAASVRSTALRLTVFFLDRPTSTKKPSPKWRKLNQDTEAVWPMNI